MKKFFKALFAKPIYFVLIFILIVFLPVGISLPPEGVDRQHVASIGIDVSDEGVEVSILSHVSNQSEKYSRTCILSSATAQNIPFALYKISAITGKKIALTHATSIVFSEEIARNGLQKYLDYFYRNDTTPNDVFLVCVLGKAKDLLSFEKERINSAGYSLEEVLVYNSKNVYFTDDNLESFYKGFFSPSQTSITAIAELDENPDGEQLLESNGGNSQTPEGSDNKKIKNVGKLGVYKNGILTKIFNPELVFGYNVVNGNTKNIYLEIENFSDEIFDNAKIIFNIENNQVKTKASFENGKPIISFSSLLSLSIDSIVTNNVKKEYFSNTIDYLSSSLKNEIENKIKFKLKNFLEETFTINADILGVYTLMNNTCGEEFNNWLNTLPDKNNFLSQVEYRMIVNPILTS